MEYKVPLEQRFSILPSKKTLWFLKGKVASSYITFTLGQTASQDMCVDFNNPLNIIEPKLGEQTEHFKTKLKRTYFKAFEPNPRKKSVILIRNPHKRFLSGFIMDYFSRGLLHHPSYLLYDRVDKEEFENKEYFLKEIKTSSYVTVTPKLTTEEFKPIWKKLIHKQLEYTLTSGSELRISHTDPWISFVYILHKEHLKDSLKIYDIDKTDLSEVLKLHTDADELSPAVDVNKKINRNEYFGRLAHQVYYENPLIQRKIDDILFDESRLYKQLIKNIYEVER
tara:strand:- start:387 stop:1229 length:843 start_codon:yes stop_codon:yes gene_type:complete